MLGLVYNVCKVLCNEQLYSKVEPPRPIRHLVDECGHDGGLVDADVPWLKVFHLAADVHGPRPILDTLLLQRQSGYLQDVSEFEDSA